MCVCVCLGGLDFHLSKAVPLLLCVLCYTTLWPHGDIHLPDEAEGEEDEETEEESIRVDLPGLHQAALKTQRHLMSNDFT